MGGLLQGPADLLFGGDEGAEAARREIENARRLLQGVKLPEHVWQNLAPEAYQSESANYNLISEDPILKGAQATALQKLAGLADSGLSAEDELGFYRAKQLGAQQAKANTQAAVQNAQARGVGGSGLEFAMREMGNQGAADRSQSAALEQAAAAARQKAMYNQAYNQALGQNREQDFRANSANSDIVNRFNQANTQQRNQTNQANVQQRNEAQRYNNEGKINTAQTNFENDYRRAGGIASFGQDLAKVEAAKDAAKNERVGNLIKGGAAIYGA